MMDISAYTSLLKSQGFTLNPSMTPPSETTRNALQGLSKLSRSFSHTFEMSTQLTGQGPAQRPLAWNQSSAGQGLFATPADRLPGPARLLPPSARPGKADASLTSSAQSLIEMAHLHHRSIMQAAGIGASVDATSTGSKRSQHNLDMLLRGQ